MSRLMLAIRAIDEATSKDCVELDAEIARLQSRLEMLQTIREQIELTCRITAAAIGPIYESVPQPEEPVAAAPAPAPAPADALPKSTGPDRGSVDPSSVAEQVYELLDEEGSLPVNIIAKRLGRTEQGVKLAMTKSGWFTVGADGDVSIARR